MYHSKCFKIGSRMLWIVFAIFNYHSTICSAQPSKNVMKFGQTYVACGKDGFCVPNKLCVNKIFDNFGTMVINPRNNFAECDNPDELCCAKIKDPDVPPMTTTTTPATSTEDFVDDPDWTGECGQRDVGGTSTGSDTKRGEFPWSVAVFAHTKVLGKLKYVFLCGGTLIDEPVVITAAACIQHKHLSELFVHVGLWDIDASSDRFTQIIQVEAMEVHKGYVSSSLINNIALLVLKDSARRGRSVNRVCLPEDNQKFETDSTCYVVGWEANRIASGSNSLLKLSSKHANREKCTNYIKHISGVLKYKLPKEHLCADYGQVTDEQNLPVPCARGPGSGMVCTLNNKREQFFLVGIASHSLRQCTPAYDVFQKTENYISWVDTLMKKYSRDKSYYRPDTNGDNEDADEDEDEDGDTSS